jgi:hypothetical protein
MIDVKLNAPAPNRMDDWVQNNSLLRFDLPTLIEKMKGSHSWAEGELNAKILVESPDEQILLTALHGGTEINSFQSSDSLTLQIIEGRLMFHSPKEYVTLEKGQLLTLHEKVKYSLTCSEETVFLMTIVKKQLACQRIKGT